MLFANQPPVELVGNADVENLQLALRAYAEAARFPAADPGAIDGVADFRLVRALNSIIGPVAAHMAAHGTVKATLHHVLSAATRSADRLPQALQYISLYNQQLVVIIRALAAKRMGHGSGAHGMPKPSRHSAGDKISPRSQASSALALRSGDVSRKTSVPAHAAYAARGFYGAGFGQDEAPKPLGSVPTYAIFVGAPAAAGAAAGFFAARGRGALYGALGGAAGGALAMAIVKLGKLAPAL